jgi:hypothetical protein
VSSIACPGPISCVAVGYLGANFNEGQGFIATQVHGIWSQGRIAGAPANAAAKPYAELNYVTCTGPGACEAVGFYTNKARHAGPMAITESGGRWGRATEVPVPANAAAGRNGFGSLSELECRKAGSCLAVGSYQTARNGFQAFAITQTGGRWHGPVQVRLPAGAPRNPDAGLASVSCESRSFCVAVGDYFSKSGNDVPMAVTWSNGRWSRAAVITSVPSGAAADASPALDSVSCWPGSCVAVGYYFTTAGGFGWMAIPLTGHSWGPATQIGLPSNVSGGSGQHGIPYQVSCPSAGSCTTFGDYNDLNGDTEPVVAARD